MKLSMLYSPETVPIHPNPIALRKAKIVYNFGLSECNRVKQVTASNHDLLLARTAYLKSYFPMKYAFKI